MFVQILDKLIKEGNIKKIGIILNGVEINRSSYDYKNGYGYGNQYGNGYYEDDKELNKRSILKSWKS